MKKQQREMREGFVLPNCIFGKIISFVFFTAWLVQVQLRQLILLLFLPKKVKLGFFILN